LTADSERSFNKSGFILDSRHKLFQNYSKHFETKAEEYAGLAFPIHLELLEYLHGQQTSLSLLEVFLAAWE